MKKQLTQERLRELLHYAPLTGVFTWLGRSGLGSNRQNAAGEIAGGKNNKGYITITVDGRVYKAHRLAWFYMTGEWPEDQIDHEDTVRDNNVFKNLRPATLCQNAQNQKNPSRNNKSGYLGVTWDKKQEKWAATLFVNGRNKRFGRYKTPEDASAAYLAAKAVHHPFSVGVAA